MITRTPGNWYVEYDAELDGWTIRADGWYIATCHTAVPSDVFGEANARYICRAVNCHEELVAALRALRAVTKSLAVRLINVGAYGLPEDLTGFYNGTGVDGHNAAVYQQVSAALARVEAQS